MPISITRVYTRTGDKGETSLVGGKRIPKDSPRIVAYGTVDELNAVVGLVRVFNAERLDEGERHRWLDEVLRKIQNQLFDLGSELATPPDAEYEGMFKVGEGRADGEQLVLDRRQRGGQVGVEGEGPGVAEHGVQLVDRAVSRDARGVFGDPLAANQRGLALVARAGVDARDADRHGAFLPPVFYLNAPGRSGMIEA